MKLIQLPVICMFICLGCISEPSHDFDLDFSMEARDLLHLEIVSQNIALVKADYDNAEPEWIDSWTADGTGCVWYTPEFYWFTEGDTAECVVYYMPGDYWNLIRTDALYRCGHTDWRNYLYLTEVDFGTLPPPPPGYAWLTGVGYKIPGVSGEFDWATRCDMTGYSLPCGVPLPGRPDCAQLNLK